MTFTVMARCPRTGALGIGLTTASINAGRVAPHARGVLPKLTADAVLVSSQAFANPDLAYRSFELLERGAAFDDIETDLRAFDAHFEYRQIGILKASGEGWVHTGSHCAPEAAFLRNRVV